MQNRRVGVPLIPWILVVVCGPLFAIGLALEISGCGAGIRHVAVVADVAFAQSVFAVDDAQRTACQTHAAPFTVQVCADTDPKIKAALQDVVAVTKAIQATPKNGTVPKDLPTLLKNLTDVQGIVSPLAASPLKTDLSTKLTNALTQAIALLSAITGGQ